MILQNIGIKRVASQHESSQFGSGFHCIVKETFQEMSSAAADAIADELRKKSDLLLCAATGSTPTLAYQFLTEKRREEPDLFRALRIVKLDEWGELPMDDAGSCETYLQTYLVKTLEVSSERYISFQSKAEPEPECHRVAEALDQTGPIDLCVLGLGVNGHLGFNEPADSLQPLPHRAELAPSSLQHSMIKQARVPLKYGLTIGMAHLLQSKTIILLVNGSHKAAAMKQLLSQRVSTHFPASFLWLHPRVFCFCDRAAIEGDEKLA